MDPHYHGNNSTSSLHRPEGPFLQSMTLSHQEATVSPGQVLLQELLWQFKQRECLALEEELQHQSCHGTLRCRRHLGDPGLLALMPASECNQLKWLCGRIPPPHIWAVLFRFREILAHNAVLPWELVYIFKQVLKDFLSEQEVCYKFPDSSPMLLPVSAPPADSNLFGQPILRSSNDEQDKQRQEIPTISSYVDKHLRNVCSYTVQQDSLPFCHSYLSDDPKA